MDVLNAVASQRCGVGGVGFAARLRCGVDSVPGANSATLATAGARRAGRDAQKEIAKSPIPWNMIRARNIVLQQRDYSCGAAALATLLRYYWGEPIEEIDVIKEIEAMLTPEELRDRVQNGLSRSPTCDGRRSSSAFNRPSAR